MRCLPWKIFLGDRGKRNRRDRGNRGNRNALTSKNHILIIPTAAAPFMVSTESSAKVKNNTSL